MLIRLSNDPNVIPGIATELYGVKYKKYSTTCSVSYHAYVAAEEAAGNKNILSEDVWRTVQKKLNVEVYASGKMSLIDLHFTKYERTKNMLDKYYQGDITIETIVDSFKKEFYHGLEINVESILTSGNDVRDNTEILLRVFEHYTHVSILSASSVLNKKAHEVANMNGYTDNYWVYYDSDFGYKAMDLYNALLDAAEEIAKELELGDIKKVIGSDTRFDSATDFFYRASFNSHSLGKMINENAIPPRGFKFFFKGGLTEGGGFKQTMILGGNFKNGKKMMRLSQIFKMEESLGSYRADMAFARVRYGVNPSFFYEKQVNAFDVFASLNTGNEDPASANFLKNFVLYQRYGGL